MRLTRRQACGLLAGAVASRAADLPSAHEVRIEMVVEIPGYTEGIVRDREGWLYFSHGPKVSRMKPDGKPEPWAEPGEPNGHKIRRDGTHVICNRNPAAMLHFDARGRLLGALSEECEGKPLRAPNDVCLDEANGGFYFTDPGGASLEKPIGTVHYVDRPGRTSLVDGGYAVSNGIALSPDGKILYVAESRRNRVMAYEVDGPGRVRNKRVFADLPSAGPGQIGDSPDGILPDLRGNLWVAHYGMRQVQVVSPDGRHIRTYPGGGVRTSNLAFWDERTLYITGGVRAEHRDPGGVWRLSW